MYAQFFGLAHEPFSIAPDPRYLFMSERHRDALAHLLYGVNGGGGFVLLTGEIGAGKTTVCRCFLEQIPRRCNVAYIFNPKLTVPELLKSICDEFRIAVAHEGPGVATVKDYLDPLNAFLLQTHAVGQNNVLIIDEAQSLSADVLEQLRLLTNLETSERKLLQIILIGQPELRTMLARPELEQLGQRVIARFHLDALSQAETAQYIWHRLSVAGRSGANPFDSESMQRIYKLSRGLPRRINLLCDRALLGAYASGKARVKRDIVDQAASEVFDAPPPAAAQLSRYARPALLGLGLTAGAVLFGVAISAMDSGSRSRAAAGAASAASAAAGAASAAAAPAVTASVPPATAAVSPAITAAAADAQASSKAAPASTPAAAAVQTAGTAAGAAASAPTDPKLGTPLPRDVNDAWRELAAVWQLAPLGDGDPCQAAQRQQVHCFRSSSFNLAALRKLDRPGIVTLQDANDRTVHALLIALSNQAATLRVGGVEQTVALAALARMWRGEFATFWRAPPGYVNPIADGGPAADWLATQLAVVQRGDAKQLAVDAGAASLQSRVHAFQSAQGLKADGLAGPMTLMQLNRAAGVDEPRLQAQR